MSRAGVWVVCAAVACGGPRTPQDDPWEMLQRMAAGDLPTVTDVTFERTLTNVAWDEPQPNLIWRRRDGSSAKETGNFYGDHYLCRGGPHIVLEVVMRSASFDALLFGDVTVTGRADGRLRTRWETSDENGAGGTDAALVAITDDRGEYVFIATAQEPGEVGEYTVQVTSPAELTCRPVDRSELARPRGQ